MSFVDNENSPKQIVMTVFLLLGGFFFFALLRYFEVMLTAYSAMQNPQVLERLNLNDRVIEPLLHNLAIVLVILVPAITMRSFAEEKRTGTYELLLTAPIRTGEIVAGKFIAAAVLFHARRRGRRSAAGRARGLVGRGPKARHDA